MFPAGAISSFPRLCRTQFTVKQMNADSNKLATTAIQMPCFEITMDISRLLLLWVFFWPFPVCGSSMELDDVFVFEGKVEAWVLFSLRRNSAKISLTCSPLPLSPPKFGVGPLALLWVGGWGCSVPRWLLWMIGNPKWSSGTALLFNIFSFSSSVKFKAGIPDGLGVFPFFVSQPWTRRRLKVVATVGTPVVVTFCTLLTSGQVIL